MTTTRFVAYALTRGAYATEPTLAVTEEASDGGAIVRDLLSAPIPAEADADRVLAEHGWARLAGEEWETLGLDDGEWTVVGRTNPGRPTKGPRRRIGVRLPVDLVGEIEQAAAAAGRSVNEEIEARCRQAAARSAAAI